MELHKNAHRRSRSRNSKLPFWLHRKEFRGEEDHCVALSTFSLCFVLHKLKRLITDLHVLHSDDLKNSSALIYGADHIFHKLQMTTSSHVLVNKSHRFWVFPSKQNKNKKSPNYILSDVPNCFKHMLTSWKPGISSPSVPLHSNLLPANTPRTMDVGTAHQQSLWDSPKARVSPAPTPEQGSGGWGGLSPEPPPFPGIGTHLLRAGQGPSQGKNEWADSRRRDSFPSMSPVFLLSAEVGSWSQCFLENTRKSMGQHKRESTKSHLSYLSSKTVTHLFLKFFKFTKPMVSFA